jgi:hypothetical protein
MLAVAVAAMSPFEMIGFCKDYKSFGRKVEVLRIELVGERHDANLL